MTMPLPHKISPLYEDEALKKTVAPACCADCGKPLEFTLTQAQPSLSGHSIHVTKCCGKEYQRKSGPTTGIYFGEPGITFQCQSCKGEVYARKIPHTVYIDKQNCAGFGNVVTEVLPYCPKCEME